MYYYFFSERGSEKANAFIKEMLGTVPRLTAPVGGTIHDPGRAGPREIARKLSTHSVLIDFRKDQVTGYGGSFYTPIVSF